MESFTVKTAPLSHDEKVPVLNRNGGKMMCFTARTGQRSYGWTRTEPKDFKDGLETASNIARAVQPIFPKTPVLVLNIKKYGSRMASIIVSMDQLSYFVTQ